MNPVVHQLLTRNTAQTAATARKYLKRKEYCQHPHDMLPTDTDRLNDMHTGIHEVFRTKPAAC
jgi:hypothetical protein